MMKNFKYDVVKLIAGVRERPCLWDKTLENYKDKMERKKAWEEIYCDLDEGYADMNWQEKQATGQLILNRWTNIRDTFLKTLKPKMGKAKKRYILHDHLSFLTKIFPEVHEDESSEHFHEETLKQEYEEETSSNYRSKRKTFRDSKETKIENSSGSDGDYTPSYTPKKSKKEKQMTDDSDYITYESTNVPSDIDFVEVDTSEVSGRLMNEDEAFFASLLPTVVNYNEDERLEFRIEVLTVMKKINDKRNWQGDD